MKRDHRIALGTLAAIGVVTAAWWALALWPAPGATPEWLARARAVCFNATESGLPGTSGWMLLIGQPLGMLGLFVVGWGRTLRGALAELGRSWSGRVVMVGAVLLAVAGFSAAGVQVARATEAASFTPPADELPPPTYPRLDRPVPADELVDQHGESVSVRDFRGETVLVTFAFGHCATICPVVVQRALSARDELPAGLKPRVVVVTLDPWRDTPERLPHLAEKWELGPHDRVLSGEVDAVEAALDAWDVPRARDLTTGDITHPALVYVVDAEGTVAYASTGGTRALVELVKRLDP